MNVILISELVNKDGSRIKGDAKVDQDNNMTTSKITTDDFVHMTRQGLSRYNNFGRIYYGEDDESKKDAKIPKKDKKKKKPKKAKKIKESGRLKMNSIKAVILNHLLSMDISDIPNEYKQELKKRLG